MAYKCSQCSRVSDQTGNCPDCNIEMTEEKVEGAVEENVEEKAEEKVDVAA
ncbi:hypothetical protein KKH14_02655 [Patescibacteria group bacterium]|nr:hypothetical protein [Patescibacteria group bacterium]